MSHEQTYDLDCELVPARSKQNNNNRKTNTTTTKQVSQWVNSKSIKRGLKGPYYERKMENSQTAAGDTLTESSIYLRALVNRILVYVFLGALSSLTVCCLMQICLFYFRGMSDWFHVCLCTDVCLGPMGSGEGAGSPVTEPDVTDHVGAGSWTWVSCKNKCS